MITAQKLLSKLNTLDEAIRAVDLSGTAFKTQKFYQDRIIKALNTHTKDPIAAAKEIISFYYRLETMNREKAASLVKNVTNVVRSNNSELSNEAKQAVETVIEYLRNIK